MKVAVLCVLAISLYSSCKKAGGDCFKVRFVAGVCNTNIYQILDDRYYDYGVNNWVNPFNGQTFDHVFVLKNHCQTFSPGADSSFMVKISEKSTIINECVTCLAIFPGSPSGKSLILEPCN